MFNTVSLDVLSCSYLQIYNFPEAGQVCAACTDILHPDDCQHHVRCGDDEVNTPSNFILLAVPVGYFCFGFKCFSSEMLLPCICANWSMSQYRKFWGSVQSGLNKSLYDFHVGLCL